MLKEILTHTPGWVFALFVLLVFLGWQQSRDRSVRNFVAFLLPVGMVLLSFLGVLSSFDIGFLPYVLWYVGLVLVSAFCYKYLPAQGIKYNLANKHFHIQGSPIPFFMMMAIFFTKYLVGIISALHTDLVNSMKFIISCSILYGAFSGVFVARALGLWEAYNTSYR